MTYSRAQNNRDENEPLIVAELMRKGCLVHPVLASEDNGMTVPDLLCASPPNEHGRRMLFLVEVKNPDTEKCKQRLRPKQSAFFERWGDAPLFVVLTIEDAQRIVEEMKDRNK
jgi:hypothetical protein